MNRIIIDDSNYLDFRDTPWDTKVFGFKTNELISITYGDGNSAGELIDSYDKYNNNNKVGFAYTRIDSQDQVMKKVLQDRGFYFAETTNKIYLNITPATNFDSLLKGDIEITTAEPEDIDHIKSIAKSNFQYGRFVEDPYLPLVDSRERYSVWVEDLVRQGANILVFRKGGVVRSFMMFKSEDKKAELMLGGSDINLGYLTPRFWSSVLTYLQKSGIRNVETTISASNIVVFNTYMLFGFKLRSTLFGFHKFYSAQ